MRTINEHLAAFADDLTLRNYSPRTASDYGYSLRALATFLDQRRIVDVAAITATNLSDFQRWLYHQPTRHGAARGVCNQNAVLAAVRSFFRFLRREGYVMRDPAAELEYAREPRRLPRNTHACRSQTHPRGRAILEVLYATGLRRNELRHFCGGRASPGRGARWRCSARDGWRTSAARCGRSRGFRCGRLWRICARWR
jgi:integrase/recombinase XerD